MNINNYAAFREQNPKLETVTASFLEQHVQISLRSAQRWIKAWEDAGLIQRQGMNKGFKSYLLKPVPKLALEKDEPVATPKELVKADLALTREVDKRKELERKYKVLAADHSALSDVVGDMLMLEEDEPLTTDIRPKTDSNDEVIPLLLFSDWHCGETVNPNTIKGLNEYDPAIAEARAHAVFRNALYLIDKVRKGGSPVHKLALWLGGDLINGHIHDEYMITNSMTPQEELLFAQRVMTDVINFLLEHGKFDQIEIFCNSGNHGRATKKKMIGAQAITSYEWMFYHILKTQFVDEPRIKFNIAEGYMLDAKIGSVDFTFHHGEAIRGGGGVGGIAVPLQRGIMKWNEVEPLKPNAFHILGHFHQCITNMRSFFMNGSVIGYNDYALEKQCSFEDPQQGMCLIVPGQRVPCEFKRIWTEVTHG